MLPNWIRAVGSRFTSRNQFAGDESSLLDKARLAVSLARREDAAELYQRATVVNPRSAAAWCGLGDAQRAMNNLQGAMSAFGKALVLEPGNVRVHARLGDALADSGDLPAAVLRYQAALVLAPDHEESLLGIGDVFARSGWFERAADSYRRALENSPASTAALLKLANLLRDNGMIQEALALYRKVLVSEPDHAEAQSALLACGILTDADPESIFEKTLAWGRKHDRVPARTFENHPDPVRRIRIGYVSGDFRFHVMARFIEPIFEAHNFSAFEVYCYDNWSRPDVFTEKLQRHADEWRDIADMSDQALAERVLRDRIDILIDLSGHTRLNRLGMFALKPAPIQVTFLGYSATTGLGAMDFRITDPYVDPPGSTERYYSETLVRLPDSMWCYKPDSSMIDVNPLPARTADALTFGSFNNSSKIGVPAIELWSDVMHAVPRSRLLIAAMPDRGASDDMARAFEEHGIERGRLEFSPRVPLPEFQRLHHRVDVALDTFPANGGTTTCESLLMGVPVISVAGKCGASRQGVSLLTNAGLPEFAAKSPAEYVTVAIRCASDLSGLDDLRQGLRDQILHSPLVNAGRYVANLEAAYRDIWQKWCLQHSGTRTGTR